MDGWMDGHSSRDPKHERQTNRVTGVAQKEARGAHNSEVTRSKRVSGIYHHIAMVHRGTGATNL